MPSKHIYLGNENKHFHPYSSLFLREAEIKISDFNVSQTPEKCHFCSRGYQPWGNELYVRLDFGGIVAFFCNNADKITFAHSYPNFYLFIFPPELSRLGQALSELKIRAGPELLRFRAGLTQKRTKKVKAVKSYFK
ncbi:hypothetical protein [Cyclobacterium sediminis]